MQKKGLNTESQRNEWIKDKILNLPNIYFLPISKKKNSVRHHYFRKQLTIINSAEFMYKKIYPDFGIKI